MATTESTVSVTSSKSHAATNIPARPRRKWRRRLLVSVLILSGLTVGGIVWCKSYFDRIEARGLQISDAGTSLNTFLKQFTTAFVERDLDALLALHDDSYASHSEGLWRRKLQTEQDGVEVYEWTIDASRPFAKPDVRDQFADYLDQLGEIEEGKFKITALDEIEENSSVIRAVLWLRGATPAGGTMESRAWFRLSLRRSAGQWLIHGKELLHGQTVIGQREGFTNITEEAGIDIQETINPLFNAPEWRLKRMGVMKYSTNGVTAADYDGDGWVDLFFSSGHESKLYRNKGGGRFEDVSAAVGLPVVAGVTVALFADLDNDGDKDLLLTRGTGHNFLFRNEADGKFTDVTDTANVQGDWVAVAAAGDYNNDGLIDLYLGRYLDGRTKNPTTSLYARNSEGNSLLRNDGDLRFTDVTAEAGVRDGGLALGVTFGDYDNDGDQDIYIANDFGRNTLFRNNGDGTFADVSKESRTFNIGFGMSSSMADVDNDGDLDIYVSAVHSGQRWFGNSATLYRYLLVSLQQGTILEDFPMFWEAYDLVGATWGGFIGQTMVGNTLMLNNGDGTFDDVTEEALANPHGWFWGSVFFDYDNDGLLDIYAANGWITGKEKDDL